MRYTASILVMLLVLTQGSMSQHHQAESVNGKPFKLALVQMRVIGGDRETNLAHAGKLIAEAANAGTQIVLLPEAMDLGWTDPSALFAAEPVPDGRTAAFLSDMAREFGVYICSGLIEKEDETVYNSAVLIDPSGKVILHHRKINELDIGHMYYALGDRLNVCRTEFGTVGLLICADANADGFVLTRSLAYMGADVILSPSSWAVPADHDNVKEPYGDLWRNAYRPVTRDFRVWIASASNVGEMTGGPWKGWKGIGCSMVIDPDGRQVVNGPYGENADTILYVDIIPEPRPAQGTTWWQYWERRSSD